MATAPKKTSAKSKKAKPKASATKAQASPAPTQLQPVPDGPKASLPDPIVVQAKPVVTGPELTKKELIDAVVAQTGAKKKDVKPTLEAALAVLGDAIAADRELNLEPFGKLRIQKVKETPTARVTIAKLRRSLGDKKADR